MSLAYVYDPKNGSKILEAVYSGFHNIGQLR